MNWRYLLDTNVVSAPIMKTPNPKLVEQIKTHAEESAIAAPVWHELVYGVERLPPGKRRKALERYLYDVVQPAFTILPYDERASTWHGVIRARLEKSGTPLPFVDGQIAAIAHVNGLAVVTANEKNYRLIEELRVEDWSA